MLEAVSDLLPCPFCGHPPTHYNENNWITCTNWDGCAVHPGIDKRGRDMSKAQAIALWNRRAPVEPARGDA